MTPLLLVSYDPIFSHGYRFLLCSENMVLFIHALITEVKVAKWTNLTQVMAPILQTCQFVPDTVPSLAFQSRYTYRFMCELRISHILYVLKQHFW